MDEIYRAIYNAESGSCQVVLLQAPGGLGKSRLVEEVLWRGGNPLMREMLGSIPDEWNWQARHPGQAIFANLIDMAEARYHARLEFIQAVRNALVWVGSPVSFPRYDATYNLLQSQRQWMGDPKRIESLGHEAEEHFLRELKESTTGQRLVIVLDTVERLSPIGGTQWLIEKGLLQPQDLMFHTYYWFLEHLRQGDFPNITFILTGRNNEETGQRFFRDVNQAASQNPSCQVHLLELQPFNAEETGQFLLTLAESWEKAGQAELAKDLREIAATMGETLYTYTGGQPIRLALYTDLLLQDIPLPDELFAPPPAQQDLEKARTGIESQFIRLLFSARQGMWNEILRALIQAPRGLDAEQLAFLLSDATDPQSWSEDPASRGKVEEIEQELQKLAGLSLVKRRPDGRLGLQDEVYRIYARHFSGKTWQDEERLIRQKRYRKLEEWAKYQYKRCMEDLLELQRDDERRLHITIPSRVYSDVYFPPLTESERAKRNRLHDELHHWELEGLHYALLADPVQNINLEAFELADQKWLASDPDFELIIQAELWQVLTNPMYALREFGSFATWKALEERKEHALDALDRVARQDDLINWLKRFGMKQKYRDAVKFYEEMEEMLLREYPPESENVTARTWHHSLARLQRALWRDYARIFLGKDLNSVLEEMKQNVAILESLLECRQDQRSKTGEYGFIGHPAESKLKRLIGIYHNYIGYGYAQLGQHREARIHYNKAIQKFRETDSRDRLATTMNNLSRVLSESGYQRARRVCLDALELRRQLGAEVPLAYSYNTLALIDNDHYRPDRAWVEAAVAVAYFRKIEEGRGLGLALLQLGEALRRLSKPTEESYLYGDDPERILETAIQVLDEAVAILTYRQEPIRLIEAWIERGCLERDRITRASDEARKRRHYQDAINYLQQAANLSRTLQNVRLELDARVNIAWTHYAYAQFQEAEAYLEKILREMIPDDARLTPEHIPSTDRDDLYLYQQLSKIHGLKGRMALQRFSQLVEKFKQEHPEMSKEERQENLDKEPEVQKALAEGAEQYTLSIAYAFLLSPTSSALDVTYDALYNFVKGFNRRELERFNAYCRKFQQLYRLESLSSTHAAQIVRFLHESFGVPLQESKHA